VQHFARRGVKATKEGWENDCFMLAKPFSDGSKPLFFNIAPLQGLIKNIDSAASVRETKVAEKKYNLQRDKVRESHWQNLKLFYFENGCDEHEKLIVKSEFKNLFVTKDPVCHKAHMNAWRQKKCVHRFSWQIFLVFIALITGFYSYLEIAKGIEIEQAVQVGLDVLNDVSLVAWVVFIVYNSVVVIYYWGPCWNSLTSGCYTFCSMLYKCFGISTNQMLETAFKPTWSARSSSRREILL